MRYVLGSAALLLATILAVGCGSGSDEVEFTYTPLPITVGSGEQPVAIVDGVSVVANEVLVLVEEAQAEQFESWLNAVSFSVTQRRDSPPRNAVRYIIAVPVGSVVEARQLVSEQPGVIGAQLNIIFGVDDP